MKNSELKKFDPITVKGNTYGKFQFYEHMPKNFEGHKFKTCKVLHSSDNNFDFAIVKLFRLSDIKFKNEINSI